MRLNQVRVVVFWKKRLGVLRFFLTYHGMSRWVTQLQESAILAGGNVRIVVHTGWSDVWSLDLLISLMHYVYIISADHTVHCLVFALSERLLSSS